MIRFIIILGIVASCIQLNAQNEDQDSDLDRWIRGFVENRFRSTEISAAFADSLRNKGLENLNPREAAWLRGMDGLLAYHAQNFEQAESLLVQSMEIYKQDSELNEIGLNSLGHAYYNMAKYDQAIESYTAAARIIDISDSTSRAINFNSMGQVYERIGENDLALKNFRSSIAIYKEQKDSIRWAGSLGNLGVTLYNMRKYDEAIDCYKSAIQIAEIKNMRLNNSIFRENYGKSLIALNRNAEASIQLDRALELSKELNDQVGIISVSINQGQNLLSQGKAEESIPYLESALALADSINSLNYKHDASNYLSSAYSQVGNFKKAFEYQSLYKTVHDSLYNISKTKELAELQTKYNTLQQDVEIAETNLRLEKEERKTQETQAWLMVVAVAFIFLLITSVLLYRNHRHRQFLASQKLENMKKEQALIGVRSMIAGEEKERSRIAKDLHDGLSGVLAAIKLQFEGIKRDHSDLEKNSKYSRAINSLDDASSEVRRIAHNMMPQVLIKYGLIDALEEFFNGINSSKILKVDFQHFGMEQRLEASTELTIYRITQELINNIIKHASAQEVMVQFMKRESLLSITVEDDGLGFDVKQAEEKEGLGLKSLKSRVNFLNGEINIESSREIGTTVYIDIALKKEQDQEVA